MLIHIQSTHQLFDPSEEDIHFKCLLCGEVSYSTYSLKTHYEIIHSKTYECREGECKNQPKSFSNMKHLRAHQDCFHSRKFTRYVNTMQGSLQKWRILIPPWQEVSIEMALLVSYKKAVKDIFMKLLNQLKMFKFTLVCIAQCFKLDEYGDLADQGERHFRTRFEDMTYSKFLNYDHFIHRLATKISRDRSTFETRGSGWVMGYLSQINIEFAKLSFLGIGLGGCITPRIYPPVARLLKKYKNMEHELIDVSCAEKEDCFFYAVSAAKCLENNPTLKGEKLRLIAHEYKRVNLKTAKFSIPFHIKDIRAFEKQNEHLHLAVTCYTFCEKEPFVLHSSSAPRDYKRVFILLLQPGYEQSYVGHYVAIRSLPRFLTILRNYVFPVSGQQRRALKSQVYACELCLVFLTTNKREFETHVKLCKNGNKQLIQFPEPDFDIRFDYNSKKMNKLPFIGFLDFEAKMKPQENKDNYERFNCENCLRGGAISACSHSERFVHEQKPMTFSLYIFSSEGKLLLHQTTSHDQRLMKYFFQALDIFANKLNDRFNRYKELHWSERLEKIFLAETKCHICKETFNDFKQEFSKVRDHCHLTPPVVNSNTGVLESKYLGAAHSKCNLSRSSLKKLPIYVHNLMSYDVNFFLSHAEFIGQRKYGIEKMYTPLSAMPYNGSKVRCFNLGIYTFLDSYQILSGSLAELAQDFASSKMSNFKLLRQGIPNLSSSQLGLLMRKSVYPYEWVRSVEQLKSTKDFPSRDDFFTQLKGDTISQSDYEHGKQVYRELSCQNMLEYTELYCKLDTLLLAEIMFAFRTLTYQDFGLAIEHYISAPQLSFDACLKTIGHPIQVMTDPTMTLMVERNIRGGVSFVNNRLETADPDHDALLYIDANNLYGFAQKMSMPLGEYKWVPENQIPSLKWLDMTMSQPIGYIAMVDLEVPSHLHDKFDNFPLAPEHIKITYDMLSSYSKEVQTILAGSEKKARKYKQDKLLTTLEPKTRYVTHYLNLQYYLKLGMKLKHVHCVMQFKQSQYLKPYINLLSEKRAESASPFQIRFYKLLINALYGKFIQDVRKYCTNKFARTPKALGKLVQNPFFMWADTLSDDVTMVQLRQSKILLNKLYAVGFSILELSKLHMYQMWYNTLQPRFGKQLQLVLTDTDSFVIKVNGHTKEKVLKKISSMMDFSNYDHTHHLYDASNKKVPGYFKDENPHGRIEKVVALKSKCYSLQVVSKNIRKSQNVCKGISQKTSSQFPLSYYEDCISRKETIIRSSMMSIRAKKYKLYLLQIMKTCMNSFDDKRFLLCPKHSVPYGHYNASSEHDKCPKCN